MKIAVSACLLGVNCKYNGGNNRNEAVLSFVKGHEILPVCPEAAGGLPTPRIPCEIVCGTVTDKNGHSRDRAYREGARRCLDEMCAAGAELAVLQPRSPSCGVRQIYDGTFSGKLIEGSGVFAALLKENGIPVREPEDLKEEET